MRSKSEIELALGYMMEYYEMYRTRLCMSPSEAQLNVLKMYDDFLEWLTDSLEL